MSEQEPNALYTEILKLKTLLDEANIPYALNRNWDGWHLAYPCPGEHRKCSVREFCKSRGASKDRLEIYGLLNSEERKYDDIVGWLTAENVFDRIKRDRERRQKRSKKQ